jgi:hypothetical protein
MTLHLARSILSLDDNEARCQLLFDRAPELIWDEYGDEVEQFNRLAPAFAAAGETRAVDGVASAVDGGIDAGIDTCIDGGPGELRIRYRGRTADVPLAFDHEDNLRTVYTLSQLTREDLEFRLCRDTVGNSEHAFLMLPPGQWRELEREFGPAAVAGAFLALSANWEDFVAEAFGAHRHDMALDLVVRQAADTVEQEVQRFGACEVVRARDDDNYVELTVITRTNAERDRLFAEPAMAPMLERLVAALQSHGLLMRCVAIESWETANKKWGGLFMEPLMRASSPHFWFNRKPQDV